VAAGPTGANCPTGKISKCRTYIINSDILDLDGNGRSEIIRTKRKLNKIKEGEKISTTSTNHENPMAFWL